MLVFSVETSCDETSVCIINDKKTILSHIIYSQEEHNKFGGVIPELASRAHLQILQKISKQSLKEAKISIRDIDIFCATCGPGLIGGLLVGSVYTKALAIGAKKPFVPINHLEAHLLSPSFNNEVNNPHLSFLLTGGHTQIFLIQNVENYNLLGETLDDAVGEAFDKVSKLLGMSYPGGPEIENVAKNGDHVAFDLPHPLKNSKELNFSFSGIKTAISLIVKNKKIIDEELKSNISASFQNIVSEILVKKFNMTIEYLKNKNINITQLSLVGGVAANKFIYNKLAIECLKNNIEIILPPKNMLSDNAAMVGWACIKKLCNNNIDDLYFKENPRLTLGI
ncbi:tRNA (adenosine(37)-N6)-threonylcarbamoyltransferase complex transferase subunit TsaD [Alphaproteobacteria bacterium]|nr:tRNA (adenosine(37)-N6)-threonylcarbamoyltransferase complex transferase subunit TsaD [Alphaproteobacteria bacterium]